jgi:Brp/Blh family beta-carotene 15,15'-monooxygenase
MDPFLLKLKKSSLLVNSLFDSYKIAIWTKIATSVAVLVFATTISLSFFFPALDFRLNLLITGLVFLGMPHGALDVYLLKQMLQTKQKVLIGLLIYISFSLPILFLWPSYPTGCFLFFILYSLLHFTDSDMQDSNYPLKLKVIEFFARVSLPFCLPFMFHESETLKLVSWIHPDVSLMQFKGVFVFFGSLSLVFVSIHTMLGFIRFFKNLKEADITFFEPLVVSILFISINPLYAFGIYFCFIHSIKHVVNVLLTVKIPSPVTILPYWLVPLVGIPILFYLNSLNQEILGQSVFQYIIVVLSSLALPHSILIRYGKSKHMIK